MKCPYCVSEIDDEAAVCKTCKRDIYLFKPMLNRLAELEAQLEMFPDRAAYETRLVALQDLLDAPAQPVPEPPRTVWTFLIDVSFFIVLPLLLLLAAHALITIVYDLKMIYLRIISILLPLPFGFLLFATRSRRVLPWLVGVVCLAVMAVVGMSAITGLVDHTAIWPQSIYEWREVIEYAASITFSFLSGMLLGGLLNTRKTDLPDGRKKHPLLGEMMGRLGKEQASPANLQVVAKKLNELATAGTALFTTGMAIYTGLKGLL